ncbi:MAG: HAMP domain-containing protein [Alcaligenaceae bacterium]|nr:HAMP domain-containing protein [Alcaligenaceae bacterium]
MLWLLKASFIVAVLAAFVLLGLLVGSTGNTSRFAQQFDILLLLNGALALALFIWVLTLAGRLVKQLRNKKFGARLTSRFAMAFAVMAVIPGVVIYLLSVQFMSRSVESWFNVKVDSALESGLALGQASLDSLVIDLASRARSMAGELSRVSDQDMPLELNRLREYNGVTEALVFSAAGNRVVAFSSSSFGSLLPSMPPASIVNQLKLARQYARAEEIENSDFENPSLRIRVIMPVFTHSFRLDAPLGAAPEPYWLQLTHPVPDKIGSHLNQVQKGFRDYEELALSRLGIRNLYGITLTMALLLTVFASIGVALAIARQLVKPLLTLAEGTQAVAVGDYRPLPEPDAKDEVGQLTRSFNMMTKQLDEARKQVERNRLQLERSNVYLESVMAGLSSGVIVFDERFNVTTVNKGAQVIMNEDLRSVPGRPLEVVASLIEFTQAIRKAFSTHAAVGSDRYYWQEQIEIKTGSEEKGDEKTVTLLMRGTRLRVDGRSTGYVVVFDDISEVISANRAVAWGEVARRLAHEIKNPLTPIQLSAERLAMKLTDKLQDNDAQMLIRSTNTIVNQVTSLKKMVDDFREYARTPPAQMQQVDINALITDLAFLYGWDPDGNHAEEPLNRQIGLKLEASLPNVEADPTQLRQVLNNLMANSRDAMAELDLDGNEPGIMIHTLLTKPDPDTPDEGEAVRITLEDRGCGFTSQVLQNAFEPYVTTKVHGTGLGLAIVRKIVEEHGGKIDISNRKEGGARITILLTKLVHKSKKTLS